MNTVVGVVGAGVMGRGVALSLVMHGFAVLLADVDEKILHEAGEEIGRSARLTPILDPKLPRIGEAELTERIRPTVRLEDLAEAEFVIENTTEKWETKRAVYRQLDAICPPQVS